MATFGLSTLPPRPAVAPKPASAPILATSAAAGAVPVSAPLDTGALVGAIQAGFREVMQELSARTAPPSESHAATATLSPELLVGVMRDSIREAMVDALKSVEHPMAPIMAGTQASPDWSGFEKAFRGMLEELKESLRPNLPPLAGSGSPVLATSPSIEQVLQELIGVIKRQSPPGEAISELIREGIGGAMEEMLATLMVQLRTSTGHSESGPAALESVAAALRESQEGIVSTIREVIEATRQAQDVQGARLAELAEAAVHTTQQTSQLVEASLVQNERMHNLRQGKRAQHASVSSFGAAPQEAAALHAQEDERVRDALEAEVPLEGLTFDTFFAGKANAFTLKMAQSVAEKPGGEYNPLFLFGNVGLGKTHLVSAAGNYIRQAHPGHRVGYVSASHFSRRLKEALAADAQDAFRENYCHWDVLILDDIQFLGGRVEAQEEFFHIFNVLHQQGRQIIIASDKAPDRLGLLEQRLISRFSSGIVADLKPPEWETRMQILRRHAGVAAVQIPEEILSLIATRVSSDIRKMVGSLRKVAAFASMTNEPVTVEMATEVLSHLGGEEAA